MNTLTKTFVFISAAITLIAISIFGTLGIQSWQKDHAIAIAAQTQAATPLAPVQLAQVIAVTPHFETIQRTIQHCHPIRQVIQSEEPSNPPVAGTVLGGLAGGLLGSQLGRGHGRDLAIAGGAVAGALTGGSIERNNAAPQTQIVESLRCRNQNVASQIQKGYEVTYLYNGQQGVVKMDTAPILNSLIPPPVTTMMVQATVAASTTVQK